MNVVRGLVSKKKNRFVEGDFDLDLSYIPHGKKTTNGQDKLIAMGFPSEGAEAMYRNPLSEVKRFFETYHSEHYKVCAPNIIVLYIQFLYSLFFILLITSFVNLELQSFTSYKSLSKLLAI